MPEGLHNTQPLHEDAYLALEQDPILTLISASNSRSILGIQQVAFLAKAEFSASILQFLVQITALVQPSLPRAQIYSRPELDLDVLALKEADTEGKGEDIEAVLEEGVENFSYLDCRIFEEGASHNMLVNVYNLTAAILKRLCQC